MKNVMILSLFVVLLSSVTHAFQVDRDSFFSEQGAHASRLILENLEKISISKDSEIPNDLGQTIQKLGFSTAFQWQILGTGNSSEAAPNGAIGRTYKFLGDCFKHDAKSDWDAGFLFQNCRLRVLTFFTSTDNQLKKTGSYFFEFENRIDLNKGVSEITDNVVKVRFVK